MRVVTTYNPETWGLFAKNNIESMIKHIDAEVVVYQEPFEQEQKLDCKCKNLFEVPGIVQTLTQSNGFEPSRGMFIDRGKQVYNYHYDVWKFCRKVFAICDAAEDISECLMFLDADVEVLQDVTQEMIKDWVGDDAIALFQRENWHSEGGIVVYNLLHPLIRQFFDRFRDLYTSGHIYQIPMGWHDCWAMDACIDGLKLPVKNLSPVLTEGLEVVSNSMLSPYFRHDKGAKKYAV